MLSGAIPQPNPKPCAFLCRRPWQTPPSPFAAALQPAASFLLAWCSQRAVAASIANRFRPLVVRSALPVPPPQPPSKVRQSAYLQGGSTAPLVLRPCWVARPRSLCGALKRIGFSHRLQPATSAHNLHWCLSYSGSPRKEAPPPPLPRSSVRGHLWAGSGSRARRGARLRGEVTRKVLSSLFCPIEFGSGLKAVFVFP